MGTSSSYGGPVGSGALLPPWAPEPPSSEEQAAEGADAARPEGTSEEVPTLEPNALANVTWRQPKAAMSRFARSGGASDGQGRSSLRNAVGGHVRAQGGSRAAARAAQAGRTTAATLGSFLSSVAADGVASAARTWNLAQYIGADTPTLLAALVDRLAPDGALLEEAAARIALADTLEELIEGSLLSEPTEEARDVEGSSGLDVLENLTTEGIRIVLERLTANYVYTRIIQTLGDRIHSAAKTVDQAVQLEAEVRDFVLASVRFAFDGDLTAVDWSGPDGRALVEQVFEAGYHFLMEST